MFYASNKLLLDDVKNLNAISKFRKHYTYMLTIVGNILFKK